MIEEEESVPDWSSNLTVEQVQLAQERMLQKSTKEVVNMKYKTGLIKMQPQKGKGPKIKLCVLPPNFKFPSMTPPQLIENWFIGDLSSNVPPFCTLEAADVSHIQGAVTVMRKK